MQYIATRWGNRIYTGDTTDQIISKVKPDILAEAEKKAIHECSIPCFGKSEITQKPYIYQIIYKKDKIIIGATCTCAHIRDEIISEWSPTTTFTLTKM